MMNADSKTLPEIGLYEFQIALNKGILLLHECIENNLMVHLDFPNSFPRFTYAIFKLEKLVGTAQFAKVLDASRETFQIGYAVFPEYRQQGYGEELISKSIKEFTRGYEEANGVKPIIEAVILPNNKVSINLARKYISQKNDITIDKYTGVESLFFSNIL